MSDRAPEVAETPKSSSAPPPAADHGHAHDDHGHDDHGDHDPIHAANPHLAHHFDTPQQQFDAGKLGIWLFLLTEVLFFAGLFCAYTVYRAMRPEVFVYAHYFLDTRLGAINTCVLLVSSLTAAWAVRNAQLGQHALLKLNIVITICCAFGFLGIKYVEYHHKFEDGLLPGPRFAPTEQVWELPSFKAKHPEAAEYAERLVKRAEKLEGSKQGAAVPAPAVLGGAAPTSSTVAGNPPAAASAAATGSAPLAPGAVVEAKPELPHGTTTSAGTSPAETAPEKTLLSETTQNGEGRPTLEQVEPLIAAGVIGPKAENRDVPSRPRNAHVFFSVYFFMTGLHGIHVAVGIGVWIWMLLKAMKNEFGPNYFGPIDYTALYWHLVDLIWIYLFPLLYLIH
ncbi:MAG TPA: cytochrome c oxidase subunit 3 [Polyangiaceae bacterium]|nr:cytochrome c oxidase subunit 3 [Polyangiaceae bacterium]